MVNNAAKAMPLRRSIIRNLTAQLGDKGDGTDTAIKAGEADQPLVAPHRL